MPCDLNFQLQQITQPCNFQHDEQIFIHCYFLLLLMPEPLQYICPRFDTRRISQVIATYFELNLFKKGCFHCYLVLQILSLFQTKKYNFPYPFSKLAFKTRSSLSQILDGHPPLLSEGLNLPLCRSGVAPGCRW